MAETDLIPVFVERNAGYYRTVFGHIQEKAGWQTSFNLSAAVFGPLWAGMRGLTFLFLLLCFLDLLALTQISDGVISGSGGGLRPSWCSCKTPSPNAVQRLRLPP